ncbi:beta-1,6-glucan boisynthesis protein-like protein [Karstenula rhodostoma CBS 690.94]|uniref:Beta-1,6-glucan boisynthesis protein-like protein n=1 Tax=Karstenula rhodostoma CBS 690.94 TaxID=1392251 RepID=A0A9P4PF54_9PLEO|nr:beta-1,6-glucan boisynthesis protein-like protein [Karstenula rhodostoma CBS 690.94]
MGRLLAPLAVLTTLATLVSAGIKITSPSKGTTLKAGDAIEVKWDFAGSGPDADDLTTYQVFLCAGPNDPGNANTITYPITTSGSFAKGGTSVQGKIPDTVGGNSPSNAYYVKIIAAGSKGGTYTVFSDRFSYKDMKSSFSAALTSALSTVKDTTGPAAVDTTVKDPADVSDVADDEYDVEYTMQTGATRFAPMQPVPPTKITAKQAKPLYPTSSVKIATAALPIPSVQTTITQSQTHKVTSMENTVAAAPMPSDDMAKFLRRWAD